MPKPRSVDRELMATLNQEGLSYADIAARLGCGRSSVYRLLNSKPSDLTPRKPSTRRRSLNKATPLYSRKRTFGAWWSEILALAFIHNVRVNVEEKTGRFHMMFIAGHSPLRALQERETPISMLDLSR
jgi:hypothetical protein